MNSDKIVAYFYDEELGNYSYGDANPMRPHRLRLTHNLVENYGLANKLLVRRPKPRDVADMTEFHADGNTHRQSNPKTRPVVVEYVGFLKHVTPDNKSEFMQQLRRFNVGVAGEADCPVFDGLFEYCQLYTGGSVDGAALLNTQKADICLNWAGGMHHAKKAEASGFCYINDIVLAILELLKIHQRVLYVDIDVHHGDGVEEAFYATDRVMTVSTAQSLARLKGCLAQASFHKHGDFFPGTGALGDIGYDRGKYYALNVPLREGMDDESYKAMFEPIMTQVLQIYQPNAIVVCAGADSLAGDRIGCFNLSLEGHSNCVEFLAKYNVPMLVLGGGGYTMRNVSRCWTYETGRLMGCDLPDELPDSALTYHNFYMDTGRLRIQTSNMRNANTREYLEKIRTSCLQNLSKLPAAPGAPIEEVPPLHNAEDDVEMNVDEKGGGQRARELRTHADDLSDDEGPQSPASKRTRLDQDFNSEIVKQEAPASTPPPAPFEPQDVQMQDMDHKGME